MSWIISYHRQQTTQPLAQVIDGEVRPTPGLPLNNRHEHHTTDMYLLSFDRWTKTHPGVSEALTKWTISRNIDKVSTDSVRHTQKAFNTQTTNNEVNAALTTIKCKQIFVFSHFDCLYCVALNLSSYSTHLILMQSSAKGPDTSEGEVGLIELTRRIWWNVFSRQKAVEQSAEGLNRKRNKAWLFPH